LTNKDFGGSKMLFTMTEVSKTEVTEKLKEELFNTLKSIEPTKRETEKTKIKEKIGTLKDQGKM